MTANGARGEVIEVEAPMLTHDQALLETDYPDGLGDAWAEVCEWRQAWGWGPAAGCDLTS